MRATVLLLSIATLLPAQQTTGTIEGVVVNSVTGVGVPGVFVNIYTRQAVRYPVTTDAAGAFRVTGMQPGSYQADMEKTGFERGRHDPPEPYIIGPAQNSFRIRIEMTQLVKLSGRVVDHDGKPTTNVQVKLNYALAVGVNEQGEFVLDGIRPGGYVLTAEPAPPRPVSAQEERTEAVLTYYPSATDQTGAQRILVRGDADVSGLEIRLQTAQVHRVRGIVRDPAGNPAPKAELRFMPMLQQGPQFISSVNGEFITLSGPGRSAGADLARVVSADDGTFEFPSVPSGDWDIAAQVRGSIDSVNFADSVRSGAAAVVVGRSDVDDVQVRLAAPFALSGTIDWGDAPKMRPWINLAPIDNPGGTASLGMILGGPGIAPADGTWSLPRVSPGRYRIVPQIGPGYYPVSVTLGGQEVLGQPVDLIPGTPPIHVTYKAARGSVRGAVEKGAGAFVVLMPQQIQTIGFARAIACKPDGTFEMIGVAPGEYYAMALERFDINNTNLLADPSFLSRISSVGTRISVGDSPSSPLELKPIRWPE